MYIYIYTHYTRIETNRDDRPTRDVNGHEADRLLRNGGEPTLGCSGMWCFRMWGFKTPCSKPLTHTRFRYEVPTPSVVEAP